MKDAKGFTFVEVMITAALLCIVALGVAEALSFTAVFVARSRATASKERFIASTNQNLMENIANLQRSFDSNPKIKETLLKPENLGLAWNADQVVASASCSNCLGKMGYYVESLPNMRGLNRLTIRVTHTGAEKAYRDYGFILADE